MRLGRLGGETLCEQQLSSTNGRRAGGQVTFPAASLPPPPGRIEQSFWS